MNQDPAPEARTNASQISASRWIRLSIPIGAGLFIVALALSAILIPQLRLLHLLQALIYVAIIALTRRNSPWGFGAGVVVPTAWNCLGLFITHLIQAGALELWTLLRTGHVSQLDTLAVLLGGVAHFLLIIACMAGFLQLQPGKKQWAQFFAGGLLAMAYFALIIVITAPPSYDLDNHSCVTAPLREMCGYRGQIRASGPNSMGHLVDQIA
jgi:hypothetical protein